MNFGKREVYVLSSVAVFALLILVIFLLGKSYIVQASPSELFQCNTLKFSSDKAIDIVFFGSESETKKYSEYLLSSYPFSEHRENFNVYYITEYVPVCKIYKGVAFLCYNKDIIKAASSCPNDYIVALRNGPSEIRSSAYLNVASINTAHPLSVMLHEFGHIFANFAEEYHTGKEPPKGSQNCKATCEEFRGVEECYTECSHGHYSRSTENGVMRTLSSEDYGDFNDRLIKTEIENQASIKSSLAITGRVVSEYTNCQNQISGLLEEDKTSRIVGCPSTFSSFRENYIDSQYVFTDAPGIREGGVEIRSSISGIPFESYDVPVILTFPVVERRVLNIVDSDGETKAVVVEITKETDIEPSVKYTNELETITTRKSEGKIVDFIIKANTQESFVNKKEEIDVLINRDSREINRAEFRLDDVLIADGERISSDSSSFELITGEVIAKLSSEKRIFEGMLVLVLLVILLFIILRRKK